MKNTKFIFIFLFVSLVFLLPILFALSEDDRQKEILHEGTVVDIINGDVLVLDNSEEIDIAGPHILTKGKNYRPEMAKNIRDLLLNQKIRYEIILEQNKKYQGRYPLHELVVVYLNDKINVNEKLLREGMAYFDYGYYPGVEAYKKLNEEAIRNKKGVWGTTDPPQPIYAREKSWLRYHYVDCKKLKGVRQKDRKYYYYRPKYIWAYHTFDFDCRYCALIEERAKAEGKEIK